MPPRVILSDKLLIDINLDFCIKKPFVIYTIFAILIYYISTCWRSFGVSYSKINIIFHCLQPLIFYYCCFDLLWFFFLVVCWNIKNEKIRIKLWYDSVVIWFMSFWDWSAYTIMVLWYIITWIRRIQPTIIVRHIYWWFKIDITYLWLIYYQRGTLKFVLNGWSIFMMDKDLQNNYFDKSNVRQFNCHQRNIYYIGISTSRDNIINPSSRFFNYSCPRKSRSLINKLKYKCDRMKILLKINVML